jgi:hypothetical protein
VLGLTATVGHAQSAFVCATPYGWCRETEPADGGICWCSTGDDRVAGSMTLAEHPNPFLELKAGITAATRSSALPQGVGASHGFAGPGQYPPQEYAAYGILAFKNRASSFDRERHLMICEAFVSALPHTSEIGLPKERQMITIWPIATDEAADAVGQLDRASVCGRAVDDYGLVQAQNALGLVEQYARVAGTWDPDGRGPFLLAYAPTESIPAPGAAALVVDLSGAEDYDDAVRWLDVWRQRIQDNPEMWQGDLTAQSKWDQWVGVLREFFDEHGAAVVKFGG